MCKKISKIAYAYVIKTFSGICVAVLFLLSEFTYGQAVGDYGTRYNTGASTSWSTASNWVVCVTAGTWAGATVAGTVPANTKNVWILSGANYNMDAASGECLDLIVIGTLYNNIASKNIDIAGNLDVQGSFDWSGASTSSITVNGTFTMSGGTFSCGNSDLTLNSTVTYTSGTFTVGTNTVTYGSAGAQDIIPITYYNLSRTNGGTASLTGNTIITGNLNLNSGLILLGAYNLTLSQVSSTVTGSPSSSAMVVTDGAGLLYKNIGTSMPYSFIYPIGDNTGPNYTPVTLNFTAFSSATVNIGAQVVNVADPNLNGTETDYLKRYWTFKKSTGTLTSYTCTADFQYVSPTDVFGNENNIRASIWDNSSWTDLTLSSQSSINTGTKTLSIKYPIDRNGIQLINNHFTGRHVSPLNYYKTVASGDWKDSTIWNVSTDMITWSPTLEYPNDLNSLGIDICSGHTVTVSGDISVDRVDSVNGTLVINSGVKFNLSNNVNPDMILAGTIDNKGDINSIGTINVLAGGTYIHDRDGGVIPSATWDPASNCNVNSTTTSATGLNQTFGNFTYSSANTLALDGNMGVAGNMVINAGTVNQGNYNITLSGSLSGGGTLTQGTGTMTIGGDNTITTYNCGNGKMDYNGITQKVKGCTYNKLSISGSGSKTLQGNATVNAKFTLNGGTSFKCSTYNITFKDTTTGTGTFFPGTGAANFVTYSSASIQTVFKGT
ncbi:MAG: hypothetical protein Q8880_09750, partial [Bacteroidota bacterium]|nr:hypothetical protein [Bacteroidota bacterium]